MEISMIGIRVDANETIATGHFFRCMAIAKCLRNKGENIVFISSDEFIEKRVIAEDFEFICLKNNYKEKDDEAEMLIKLIKEKEIDTLLLDSYEVTEIYMEKLNKEVKLIYIDDMNMFKYPADVIVNYTYNTDLSLYKDRNYAEKVIFGLGSKYIPLREEFSKSSIEIKENVENIFITTGGIDNYNVVLELVKNLSVDEFKNIKKYIVVGRFYNRYEELKKLENKYLEIYQNISDIHNVMKKCDIAITAGGTTVAELCALGIPVIAFSMADNQLEGTKAYDKDGIITYAGDIRDDKSEVIKNILEKIKMFIENYDMRKNMSIKAKNIIDGQGAERIAELIIK